MKKQKTQASKAKSKKKYEKPQVQTEALMIYGAVCSGMSMAGGRKAVTTSPDFCNSARLHS